MPVRPLIRTKQDAIDFLRKEDVAFRSFLIHLSTLSTGNISLDGITKKTGEVVRGIISLSADEDPVFGKSEVVIFLAMRNNRRLLQNADACMESLYRLRRVTMEKLAERTPKALTKLEGADFPLDADGLPTLLIKTFILGYE